MSGGGGAERIESAIDTLAAAMFAGAAGYAAFSLLNGVYREIRLDLLTASVSAVAYLLCARVLRGVAPERRRFDMDSFELAAIDPGAVEELLLTEPIELLLTEQVELILTDADRVKPAEKRDGDELMLDDILAELGPNSRVVRLFDPAAMPTPGQLNARIERHLVEEPSPAASPDASQALHEALAELRRSLR